MFSFVFSFPSEDLRTWEGLIMPINRFKNAKLCFQPLRVDGSGLCLRDFIESVVVERFRTMCEDNKQNSVQVSHLQFVLFRDRGGLPAAVL